MNGYNHINGHNHLNGYSNVNHKYEIHKQKDWDIVADLYQLLVDEHVLNTQKSDSVIDFKLPVELEVCS